MTEERTKGEQAFIEQYTRSLLVSWANSCIMVGGIPDVPGIRGTPYFAYAESKGWVTKGEPRRLTASGFTAAAGFLKR